MEEFKMKKVMMWLMVSSLPLVLLAAPARAEVIIGFEAEAGLYGAHSVTAPFTTIVDERASGKLAIGTDESVGDSNNNPPAETSGWARYRFTAPAGLYKIIARVLAADSDSFWIRIVDADGRGVDDSRLRVFEDWTRWEGIHIPEGANIANVTNPRDSVWAWDVVHANNDGDREAVYVLPEDGQYEVQIARREDGVYIDGFIVTNVLGLDQRNLPDYIPATGRPTPFPADKAVAVPLTGAILQIPADNGATYDFYLGDIGQVAVQSPAASIGSRVAADGVVTMNLATVGWMGITLPENSTWYWRVDKQGGGLVGIWQFTSFNPGPVIVSQPPEVVRMNKDCPAVLEVVAKSGDDDAGPALTYQWFNAAGPIANETSPTLITSDEGVYYCQITGSSPTGVVTRSTQVVASEVNWFFSEGFIHQDIASPALAGNIAHIDGSGAITVSGSGSDIWGGVDQCHFAGRPWSGNGTFIVRLVDMYNPTAKDMDPWAKAGLMIRKDMTQAAANAYIACSWLNGVTFQSRPNSGDTTSVSVRDDGTRGAKERPIQWLKLVREINPTNPPQSTFYGYYALDNNGVPGEWMTDRPIGYVVNLTDPVYVGVAVTAHNTSRLTSAVFDNFTGDFGITWALIPQGPDPLVPHDPQNPVTLSWTHSPMAVLPCGTISYNVILETSAAAAADPDAVPLVTTQDMHVQIDGLAENTTYYYRIDTVAGDQIDRGVVKYFKTGVPVLPIVTPVTVQAPPLWTMADVGEQVILSYKAASPNGEPVTYEWRKMIDDANSVPVAAGSQLTVTVGPDTVGRYFCQSSNVYGDGDRGLANIGIKRLISHWTMDALIADPNGKAVQDSVSGYNGLLYGATEPNVVDGVIGKAMQLNGIDQWFDVRLLASQLGIEGNHPKSISVWVYTESMNDGGIWDLGDRQNGMDFSLRTESESHGDHGWRMQFWGSAFDHNFNTYDPTNNNQTWGFTTPVAPFPSKDAWVFFVLTHDGERTRIYGNGQLIVDVPRTLNTGATMTFRIGAYGAPGVDLNGLPLVGNLFHGSIDDMKLYNYALDPVTIAREYLAVRPKAAPLCTDFSPLDFDGDCNVTLADFAVWAENWVACGLVNCD
jgi:hypothetical protein